MIAYAKHGHGGPVTLHRGGAYREVAKVLAIFLLTKVLRVASLSRSRGLFLEAGFSPARKYPAATETRGEEKLEDPECVIKPF
jgi:hypothetical protein